MSAIRKAFQTNTNPPVTRKATPAQIKNNTGGFVFQVTPEVRLERFLILGTDGGTYYATEQKLTDQNLSFIDEMILQKPQAVFDIVSDVSINGKAYRNTPAIYVAAAFICRCDEKWKPAARNLINIVCRTSTHIFELCGFIDTLGGWGQAKMAAVREWYESRSDDSLKYQAVKYRGGRYGWNHGDVLRTVHPKDINPRTAAFMLGKPQFADLDAKGDIIDAFQLLQSAKTVDQVIGDLVAYPSLPWETIPTQFLRDSAVWKILFYNGQLKGQALLRNIRRMADIGAFKDLTFAADVSEMLMNEDMIFKTRLHPVQYLNCMAACGVLDPTDSWYRTESVSKISSAPICDALEAGMYVAFQNARSDDRTLYAIDVSGSMSWAAPAGLKGVSCAQAAAVMAMTCARGTPAYVIRGFSNTFVDLGITARTNLKEAFRKVQMHNFGSTNASLAIEWAERNNIQIDKFVVVTDNDINSGSHPFKALKSYRQRTGIPAKLVVVGMTATQFTIADPDDAGMLDVTGFDATAPRVIAEF